MNQRPQPSPAQSPLARLQEGIRSLATARNRELRGDAAASILVGGASTFFITLLVLWLSYILWPFAGDFTGLDAGPGALLFTGLLVGAGIWSGWRQHNPHEDFRGLSDLEFDLLMLRQSFGLVTLDDARRAIAGFADLVIGGPRQIFDGFATLRSRLPTDRATIELAAIFLVQAMTPERLSIDGVPKDAATRESLVLLRRLSLVVPGPKVDVERSLVASRKAEGLLLPATPPRSPPTSTP